jgi:hypothetical protein
MKNLARDSDDEQAMTPKRWLALGFCAIALVGAWFLIFGGGPEGPKALAAKALTDGDLKERLNAMAALTMYNDRDVALPALRQVAKQTKDPEVSVAALYRLMALNDRDSLPMVFTALDHESKDVREKAHAMLRDYYGGALPENLVYEVDNAEKRTKVAAKLLEFFNRPKPLRESPDALPPEQVAARPNESPKGTEALKATPEKTPGTDVEPRGETTSPFPGGMVPALTVQNYPIIGLLVWLCRILAVLVLVAEFVGVISLIVGERRGAARATQRNKHLKYSKADKNQPAPPDESEATRDSVALWTKISILVRGAVLVIGLLGAAEMFQLAVRMDQYMNYISSRTR